MAGKPSGIPNVGISAPNGVLQRVGAVPLLYVPLVTLSEGVRCTLASCSGTLRHVQ